MHTLRSLALLGALVPVAALVSGCGGGNSGASRPTPVPAPTFVEPPTGTPNFPTITVPQTLLRLTSGQLAYLNLTRTGGTAKGTLRILNGTASNSSPGAGLYQVSGAFSAPSAFSVQSPDTEANRFTLSGSLPQNSRNGTFNFSLGKSKSAGTLLAPNSTLFPASAPYNTVGNLQFSNFTSTDTNAIAPASVTPNGPNALTDSPTTGVFGYEISGNDISPRLDLQGARDGFANPGQALDISINLFPAPVAQANPNLLSAGQSFDLTPGVLTSGVTPAITINYAGRNYTSTSGTLTIRSIGSESIVLDFSNVRVATAGAPVSSFLVNGTFNASVGVVSAIRLL